MSTKRKLLKAMQERLESQQRQIHMMADAIGLNKQAIIMIENKDEPKLKTLDQSVFDGQGEKWRFAAVDEDSRAFKFDCEPAINCDEWYEGHGQQKVLIGTGYDASDWQNSLVERESKELTGSDLCRAMLARGDRFVMCRSNGAVDIIAGTYVDGYFVSLNEEYKDVTPINPRTGAPLTAKEAGL